MKNKLIFVFFAVTALLCCFIFSASAGYDIDTDNILELDTVDSLYECLAKGDVDNSGKIEASDARLILRVSVNLDQIDTSAFMKADIDSDGKITAQDARSALRLSVGLEKSPEHKLETVTVIPATCTTQGLTVKICTGCVKIYAQITEPASDDYHIPGSWVTVEKNTCVKDGLAQIKCVSCDEVIKELTLPATGIHNLTEWTYPEGKNCERDMPRVRTCKDCDYSEKGTKNAGHSYKYVTVQEKTCVQDGIEIYKCTECGKEGVDTNGKTVYTYKAMGYHSFEDKPTTLKEPTCTEPGISAYLCIYCDEPQAEITLPAKGHTYDKYYKVTLEPTCTEEGTADAVCTVCGDATEIVLEMIEHDIVGEGWQETLAPTCTEEGLKEGYCAYCRADVTKAIPATGHNITVWENVTPATCARAGTKKGICSVCGDDSVTEEIEKLPHSFDRATKYWYEGVPCQEPWKYYNKCTVCGAKEYYLTYKLEKCTSLKNGERNTRTITEATCTEPATVIETCVYCNKDIGKERTNGSALGHDYETAQWTTLTEATCTQNGWKTASCARNCGESTKEIIFATGHSYSDFVTTLQATCTLSGAREKTCSDCGNKITEYIPSKGHRFVDYKSDNNVTCTEDGTKTAVCSNGCGTTHTITGDKALGHSFTNYISDGNVTCTTSGTMTAVCDNGCGKTDIVTEKAKGHAFNEYIPDGNASCTERGTKTAVCANGCGASHTVEGDPTSGHSFTNYVSDNNLSCTQNGTKTAYCDNGCGTTHTIDDIKATGHSFSEYISDNNATCTDDGTKTAVCDNGCGATHSVRGDLATGHTKGEFTLTKEPSCSENGIETAFCTVCGDAVDTREITTRPDHTPENVLATDSGEIDENGKYIIKCKQICTECGETVGEEAIELFTVVSDHDIKVTELEGANAGDKITFTVDNGESSIIVMLSYGKDNTIILEETDGEYTFAIPEGLTEEDEISIIVYTLNVISE